MNIKKGDLVMVVKPTTCCGNTKAVGRIFTVRSVALRDAHCVHCWHTEIKITAIRDDGMMYGIDRLKKIDPPAHGDSLPTRADLEVTA